MMKPEQLIIAFVRLGGLLRKINTNNTILKEAITKASQKNRWFTEKNIRFAIASLGEMLEEEKIRKWIAGYNIPPPLLQRGKEKKVGVVMAGNIPLVGFHDFFCVLMSGNIFMGKLSSDDEFLLPALSKLLCETEPEFKSRIYFLTSLKQADAFIATGSNNSSRYFEYYFSKYPHLIRKNRNAVAVLNGDETETALKNLGKDIFQYFGMGCRNVSKIYIPQKYALDRFFSAIADYGEVINHNKYYNNYIYYRTIYLLNKEKFLDNNFVILKEEKKIASPIAVLYYERYSDINLLKEKLESEKENIQCVVSDIAEIKNRIKFGQSQHPELWEYADGVDTMEFLLNL